MIYTLLLLKGFQILLLGWVSLEAAMFVATFYVEVPTTQEYQSEYIFLPSYDDVPNFGEIRTL